MKTIIATMIATIAVTGFATILFLNSILGIFGYAATTLESLNDLKNSQQIVEKMKQRHSKKKLKAPKKLVKKSALRVASTTLAAATVGTIAVAVTMASLEVADYCEEKEELQNDANILYGTNVEFDIDQCFEQGKEDTKNILQDSMNSSVEAVSDAFDETTKYSAEKWAAIREASVKAFQTTGEAAGGLWDATYLWMMQ